MKIIDDLVKQPARRDQWGRYKVLPPNGTKPVGYTRATIIAKTLDDSSGLVDWGKRMVAIGLSERPDLLAGIANADKDDRKALNALCTKAAEAGGATIRRDQGTAIHEAFEKSLVDRAGVPALFRAEVDAIHNALESAGLTPVEAMSERMVVNDEWRIAGTFDLLVTDGTNAYVADIKTGSTLMGALSFATQLAIYAHADNLYEQGAAADGSEDVRLAMPDVSAHHGIIVHVQPGASKADLYWLDLIAGYESLTLALHVREIRKAKVLTKIYSPTEAQAVEMVTEAFPGAEVLVSEDWRRWIRRRLALIIEAGHKADLQRLWPDGVPTLASGEELSEEHGALIEALCIEVEGTYRMPFFDEPKPGQPDGLPLTEWVKEVTSIVDEGAPVNDEDVAVLRRRLRALPLDQREWVNFVIKECTAAGCSIRMSGNGGKPTTRRWSITEALIEMATIRDEERDALLLDATHAEDGALIGATVGSMTLAQADRLHQLLVARLAA